MLTLLIINLINMVSGFTHSLFPAFSTAAEYIDPVTNAVKSMVTFLSACNCLLPLTDIFKIVLIDFGVRLFKLTLFVGNWIIEQIVGVIP